MPRQARKLSEFGYMHLRRGDGSSVPPNQTVTHMTGPFAVKLNTKWPSLCIVGQGDASLVCCLFQNPMK